MHLHSFARNSSLYPESAIICLSFSVFVKSSHFLSLVLIFVILKVYFCEPQLKDNLFCSQSQSFCCAFCRFFSTFVIYSLSKEGDYMTAGEKIRYIRESKNMTQGELAELMGLKSKSAVSRTEASGDKITTKTVMKYAEALGVTPLDIISEEKEVSPAEIEKELKRADSSTLRRIKAYIDYLLSIEQQTQVQDQSK